MPLGWIRVNLSRCASRSILRSSSGRSCNRHTTELHQCLLDAHPGIVGELDRVRVGQVVENLVENAIKYSPQGGSVRVHLAAEGGEAHLTVRDEGIGIPLG